MKLIYRSWQDGGSARHERTQGNTRIEGTHTNIPAPLPTPQGLPEICGYAGQVNNLAPFQTDVL